MGRPPTCVCGECWLCRKRAVRRAWRDRTPSYRVRQAEQARERRKLEKLRPILELEKRKADLENAEVEYLPFDEWKRRYGTPGGDA